jgi:hypothetical protein
MAKRQEPPDLPYGPSVDKVMQLYGFSEGQYNTVVQGDTRNGGPVITPTIGSEGSTRNQNPTLRHAVAKDAPKRADNFTSVRSSGAISNIIQKSHPEQHSSPEDVCRIDKRLESDGSVNLQNSRNDKNNGLSPLENNANINKI